MKQVHVAVGVVCRNDTFFVCKRSVEQHQGGKWEFPGGKVEAHESVEEALTRELMEEIGIQLSSSENLIEIAHDYGDKRVLLSVLIVDAFTGEPYGKEGQDSQWVDLSGLASLDFPEANQAIIQALVERAQS
ncbi:8-oxo-dGTP diphosphatase MutT [Brumicola blandensis]|uniref:8-oxo-dGTP diphosphatase n=1 Tax=Brumicola blandensis TaxID=3075611 RepID=A0AAW8R4H4_9ALTE|nr:8-oxo-dGTP diphosphatase MutT [Alteromonas sp. W409]MDT0583267.1 8-oxo-dGTP diphosphatase MutT [Alteromonas sp. W409]